MAYATLMRIDGDAVGIACHDEVGYRFFAGHHRVREINGKHFEDVSAIRRAITLLSKQAPFGQIRLGESRKNR